MKNLSMESPLLVRGELEAVVILLLIFIPSIALTKTMDSVAVNEIAWMGTESSYADEWIELHNNSDLLIDIDGWLLKIDDEPPGITLTGTIPAKGFYLLKRTNDDALPLIIADQIYTGALNNKGKSLKLFDAQGSLIDEVDCSNGWFSGNNSTKQTMERKNPQESGNSPENWQSSQEPGGTPKAENGFASMRAQNLQIENKETLEIKPPQFTVYPTGIIFNEVLPSPEGPDSENEWIEIFNRNTFEIDLASWKISDQSGSKKTYIFPDNSVIMPLEFLLLGRKETGITLNNEGDGLSLFYPNGQLADNIFYEKALLGKSYGLTASGWFWNENITPGKTNRENEEVQQQEKLISAKEEALAFSGGQIKTNAFSFLRVVFTAFFVSALSGIVILIAKKKIKHLIYSEN